MARTGRVTRLADLVVDGDGNAVDASTGRMVSESIAAYLGVGGALTLASASNPLPVDATVTATVGPPLAQAATLNTGADVSLPNAGATGSLVVAANADRYTVTIRNLSTASAVRLGKTAASVALGTSGYYLGVGEAITFSNYNGDVYGNGVTAAVSVSVAEEAT